MISYKEKACLLNINDHQLLIFIVKLLLLYLLYIRFKQISVYIKSAVIITEANRIHQLNATSFTVFCPSIRPI